MDSLAGVSELAHNSTKLVLPLDDRIMQITTELWQQISSFALTGVSFTTGSAADFCGDSFRFIRLI
jgi:hypothetical protein